MIELDYTRFPVLVVDDEQDNLDAFRFVFRKSFALRYAQGGADALSMLGEREVRRWVRLVVTLAAGQEKSSELVLSALVRARFCELLSPKVQHGDSDLFLLGLLSLMLFQGTN